MIVVLEFFYWLIFAVIVYVYFGYPLLLFILSKLHQNKIEKFTFYPLISIITSAYNEENVIKNYIVNKTNLSYPKDKYEIIIVSDGSTDRTDEIIKKYSNDQIVYLRQEPRQGKSVAINQAVKIAKGDILVFSDANSIYQEDALLYLISNFWDPHVGYVTGKMIYVNSEGDMIGEGCTTYMKYENLLRSLETIIGSLIGVDGGIDAMRKKLFKPLEADMLPDFILPLSVAEQGYRVVYEDRAILKESALTNTEDEYRMRVRVSLRAWHALWKMHHLLNIFRFGFFSIQLLSHKILRYLVGFFQIFMFILNLLLIYKNHWYMILFVLQIVFYFLTFLGYYIERNDIKNRLIILIYYFNLLNFTAFVSFFKFLGGKKQVTWNPRKG